MYLSNTEINAIINRLEITVPDENHPFLHQDQIQLCSIDLRVSNIFWKQKKSLFAIDLHKNKLAELSPRRLWKKVILDYDSFITLKPGEFILGQTFERFRIPEEYAGKINARSSYARMGLETNSASDFINPGWAGHVPLEIINKSKNAIQIYPLLGMVQIFIIPLSSTPTGNYGDTALFSKYQDDDGGPSYWWRDKLLGQIKRNYESKLSETTLNILTDKFSSIDDNGLYRFEKFMATLPLHKVSNAEDILNRFVDTERKKSVTQELLFYSIPLIGTTLLGLSVALLFTEYKSSHLFAYIPTIPMIVGALYYSVLREKKKYYKKID